MREPEVKGTAFLGILKFIKLQLGGPELFRQVIESLPEEAKKVCDRKISVLGDYPYLAFIQLLRVADSTLGSGNLELCREFGRFAAVRDYQSIRSMVRNFHLSPRDLFRDCNSYWKNYYVNAGSMKAEAGGNHCVLRIYSFEQMDPSHCRLMEGWMAQAMIEAGGRWIQELRETACMAHGAPYHEFTGHWEVREATAAIPKYNAQAFLIAQNSLRMAHKIK